jgi:hypothetical protein
MTQRIIFTLCIDIPEHLLDETGYSKDADRRAALDESDHRIDRAMETKDKIAAYNYPLQWHQNKYASICGADYKCYRFDKQFLEYYRYCKGIHNKLPMYHIVNYYKHHLMHKLSYEYDEVFYMDIDVIPRTEDNIFEVHDMSKLWAKNNNELAEWGKDWDLANYNRCDRNPATKYWNCYALLMEDFLDPENDVTNTGTVIGGSEVIQSMAWNDEFESMVEKMKLLQDDEESMFPEALRSRFAFDNETMFSYLVKSKELNYDTLADEWHGRLPDEGIDPRIKMVHAINKKFEFFFPEIQYTGRTI